jgi:hypothetical protein
MGRFKKVMKSAFHMSSRFQCGAFAQNVWEKLSNEAPQKSSSMIRGQYSNIEIAAFITACAGTT